MLYLLSLFLISARALNSFTDPSLLFKLTGDSEVIDGNFVILPSSSKQIRSGGLISNEVIELESFEMQIKLAFDKTSFSSFWFSSSGQVPGPVYGLSRDFKGFGIFCDSKQGKLHLAELSSIQDPLNLSQFPSCQVDLQMVKSVHIHVRNQTFEVWLDQGKMVRCGEVSEI